MDSLSEYTNLNLLKFYKLNSSHTLVFLKRKQEDSSNISHSQHKLCLVSVLYNGQDIFGTCLYSTEHAPIPIIYWTRFKNLITRSNKMTRYIIKMINESINVYPINNRTNLMDKFLINKLAQIMALIVDYSDNDP